MSVEVGISIFHITFYSVPLC